MAMLDVMTKIEYIESNVWKPRAQKAHEMQMCPNPTVRRVSNPTPGFLVCGPKPRI